MVFDDRITRKVVSTGHVMLTCRNHQTLAWHTKNIGPIGARNIFFAGEGPRGDGTKKYNELIPSRQTALKLLADGHLIDRKAAPAQATPDGGIKVAATDTMKNTPENVAWVNEKYDALEAQYIFECACPGRDLMVDPSYDEMPDVNM